MGLEPTAERINAEEGRKDKRLPKQVGDFGEGLVSFILSKYFGYKVIHADHAGFDILAIDFRRGRTRLAVEVKTNLSDGYPYFEESSKIALVESAEDLGAESWIAFVIGMPPNASKIDSIYVYISPLDDWLELAKNESKAVTINDKGDIHVNHSTQRNMDIINENVKYCVRLKVDDLRIN